jgi:hypothetical protein
METKMSSEQLGAFFAPQKTGLCGGSAPSRSKSAGFATPCARTASTPDGSECDSGVEFCVSKTPKAIAAQRQLLKLLTYPARCDILHNAVIELHILFFWRIL